MLIRETSARAQTRDQAVSAAAASPEPAESSAIASIDRRLRALVLERLSFRGISPSRDLAIEVHLRDVSVRGRVHSYYQKQLIVHSIRLVPGVRGVHDALEVIPPNIDRRSLCSGQPRFARRTHAAARVALTPFPVSGF